MATQQDRRMGFVRRFGIGTDREKSEERPWNAASSWVHNAFSASTASRAWGHRVHTGDKQRHAQASMESNTGREARQQTPGQITNEKWLTARQSTPMRER